MLVEHWLGGANFPKVNVPVDMIEEMIRAKEEPVKFQISKPASRRITLTVGGFAPQLCDLEWPNLENVLLSAWEGATLGPVGTDLREACAKLAKFDSPLTYFRGSDVATERQEAKDGIAAVAVVAPATGCFHTRHLADVLKAAETICWNPTRVRSRFRAG